MQKPRLVWSRAAVTRNWALLPPEGVAESVLPEWKQTVAKILAAPAMGAAFAQYDLVLARGGGSEQQLPDDVECFFFVHEGSVELTMNGTARKLASGGFAYGHPGTQFRITARGGRAHVLWLKKRYVAFGTRRPRDVWGNERRQAGEHYLGVRGLILKKLLPEDLAFDMAMNVFTFPPGYSLPVIETHVMEHGLVILEGQGVYYLGDRWMEVLAGDFIWMGPYVPQSFYATGLGPSRYLYYKDVHRDVSLP